MTLVILAAGMGSRYGGLKQIDPITTRGEFIIDFSVFDAIRAGFDKIVFVIKEENLNEFKETIGKRFENKITVEYAFQKLDDIPEGFSIPEGRVKPWGTAHALLAAKDVVRDNFAVINVKHDGPEDITWHGFMTEDVTTNDFELFYSEYERILTSPDGINGLKKETADLADCYLKIPMEGKLESLNAAVAAALLMYQAANCNRD